MKVGIRSSSVQINVDLDFCVLAQYLGDRSVPLAFGARDKVRISNYSLYGLGIRFLSIGQDRGTV